MAALGSRSSMLLACAVAGCIGPGPIPSADESADESGDGISSETTLASESETTLAPDDGEADWGPTICDFGHQEEWPPPVELDLLLVIDNSPTTLDEQVKLVSVLDLLVEQLEQIHGENPLDVNVMITTSDVGHPLCVPGPGYEPKQGAPEQKSCVERLDYTNADVDVLALCEQACPVERVPAGPFAHFTGPASFSTTNVPGNEVIEALRCLAFQGIQGCEYGAPLEAMLRALDPNATWNQGDQPFLRTDSMLAIAFVGDTYDCSVRPEGYAYFTDPLLDQYWAVDPESGSKAASPAICWNAGVECGEPDSEGVYAGCSVIDGDVLHPLGRYADFLAALEAEGRTVMMLDLLGVPSNNAELLFRDWRDGLYPDGDLLPGEPESAATKQFEFGIGPACVGYDPFVEPTNQTLPSPRLTQLCESLDGDAQLRCCIESSCVSDYSSAIGCLTGAIETHAFR